MTAFREAFLELLEKLYKKYINTESALNKFCRDSIIIYSLTGKFLAQIKNHVNHSFIIITSKAVLDGYSVAIFNEKRLKNWLDNLKSYKNRIQIYSDSSLIVSSCAKLNKLHIFTIDAALIILFIAITTNIVFVLLFSNKPGLIGLVLRGMIWIIVLSGIICYTGRNRTIR